jgi:hypothetical protein
MLGLCLGAAADEQRGQAGGDAPAIIYFEKLLTGRGSLAQHFQPATSEVVCLGRHVSASPPAEGDADSLPTHVVVEVDEASGELVCSTLRAGSASKSETGNLSPDEARIVGQLSAAWSNPRAVRAGGSSGDAGEDDEGGGEEGGGLNRVLNFDTSTTDADVDDAPSTMEKLRGAIEHGVQAMLLTHKVRAAPLNPRGHMIIRIIFFYFFAVLQLCPRQHAPHPPPPALQVEVNAHDALWWLAAQPGGRAGQRPGTLALAQRSFAGRDGSRSALLGELLTNAVPVDLLPYQQVAASALAEAVRGGQAVAIGCAPLGVGSVFVGVDAVVGKQGAPAQFALGGCGPSSCRRAQTTSRPMAPCNSRA